MPAAAGGDGGVESSHDNSINNQHHATLQVNKGKWYRRRLHYIHFPLLNSYLGHEEGFISFKRSKPNTKLRWSLSLRFKGWNTTLKSCPTRRRGCTPVFSGIQTAGMVTSGCMNADVCNLEYVMRFKMRSREEQHRVSWVKVGACRTKKNAGGPVHEFAFSCHICESKWTK